MTFAGGSDGHSANAVSPAARSPSRIGLRRGCGVVVLVASVFTAALSAAAAAAATCPNAPPAVRDLTLERYYSDADGAAVDPDLAQRHEEAARPLADMLRLVAREADAAAAKRDPLRAGCAAALIAAWAEAGALLGAMSGPQAEHQRKWDLAGFALAYLKVRPMVGEERRRVIEPWLATLAGRASAYFADGSRKRNNHWYWLGVGLAATALATGDPRHMDEARRIMEDAARAIDAEGILPLEMARAARALHYHAFATTALVALAELGATTGEDWYALEGGALHRLVAATARGLASPAAFDRRAGVVQERPVKPGAGWLALYLGRFPGRIAEPLPAMARGHRWLGGDVTVLARSLAALRLAQRR